MAYDGLVCKAISTELENCLIGGKINKIFQPTKNEIILGIYSNGKNYALTASISSNNYKLHLTTHSKPNPISAPNFCMVLRKHLVGSKIDQIYMNELERVIIIELQCYNELNDKINKKLIIELMGKHSNVILTNENNMIIDSMRHLDLDSNSYRDILPAHEYVFPNSDKTDFLSLNKAEFIEKNNSFIANELQTISSNASENNQETNTINLAKIFSNEFTGFSYSFVNKTFNDLNLEIEYKIDTIDNLKKDSNINKSLETIYEYILNLINNSLDNNIGLDKISEKDYCLLNKENIRTKCEVPHLQINFFLDDFFYEKETNETFKNYRDNLLRLILSTLKKVNKKLININAKLRECDDMEKYRVYGELITNNLYRLSNQNTDSVTLENYYDNYNEIAIPLDKTISPSNNAKKYFKKYSKLKNALHIVNDQKIDAQKEIDYLESIVYELESSTTISEVDSIYNEISENVLFKSEKSTLKNKNSKGKNVKTKLLKTRTASNEEPIVYKIDKYMLYVGKNNKQNDYLSTKLAKPNDLWFHTKDVHGSHAILITNGDKINDDIIVICAQIAAYHSKARISSNVPVDYTFGRYLRKPSGSKPGMITFTNNNTINVNPKDGSPLNHK